MHTKLMGVYIMLLLVHLLLGLLVLLQVSGLSFRPGTHTLYSCSYDRTVKIWSLDDAAYVDSLFGHQV